MGGASRSRAERIGRPKKTAEPSRRRRREAFERERPLTDAGPGYYATVGSILRPFRFAVAIGLAPTFDRAYATLSDRLKVPRAAAIFLVTLATNVAFTVALLLVAVNVLCAALGVAPVPL